MVPSGIDVSGYFFYDCTRESIIDHYISVTSPPMAIYQLIVRSTNNNNSNARH